MTKRLAKSLAVVSFLAPIQETNCTCTTLSANYPSLVHLAGLLAQHPDYRVKITGYTAHYGSAQHDERLALHRAETVRNILVKYGATLGQISVSGVGAPEPDNTGPWP